MNLILFLYVEFSGKKISHSSISDENEFDDSKRLLNMHDFEYIIPQTKCKIKSPRSTPYFVVLIHSAPLRRDYRKALRETWFHSDHRMLSYFMLGKVNSPSLQRKIEKENEEFDDIIQGVFVFVVLIVKFLIKNFLYYLQAISLTRITI